MSDSLITIVAIFLAAILMFVFPLMSVAERSDDISQLSAQTAITEFVDDSRTIGKITYANYDNLVKTLAATGNAFEIELEHKILDESVGKKSGWTSGSVIGENVYVSVYTTPILKKMNGNVYNMKEGDILVGKVKNINVTLAQSIRSAFYSVSGSGSSQIVAQHTGVVTSNAK